MKHFHIRTLSLKSAQSFETKTEPDLDPYTWNPESAETEYYNKTTFQGDVDLMGYGDENPKILMQSKALPRKINQFELRALELHDEVPREPIKKLHSPRTNQICRADFRGDASVSAGFNNCVSSKRLGVMKTVNERVFPDPRTRPNYIIGGFPHRLVSLYHLFRLLYSPSIA
jgi:hypothetical protein